MTYLQLATVQFSHWNIGEKAIRNALEIRGYKSCVSQGKPPLSEENKRQRLLFARSHLSWTIEQWNKVLRTDESWITGGQYTRLWVTRETGEEFDEMCLSPWFVRRNGWMFWGSFHGNQKGSFLVW